MTAVIPTFPRLVAHAAEAYGSRTAVIDGPVRMTYRELASGIERITRGLMAAGVRPGDRVSVWSPNSHHWILAALAVHGAGAALVPLNTRYTGSEAHELLGRSGARVLFLPDRFLGRDPLALLRAGAPDGAASGGGPVPGLPELELVVRVPIDPDPDAVADAQAGVVGWDGLQERGEAVDPAAARARSAAVTPDDVADVLFTSGTTGRAKGATSAHRQTIAVSEAWAECGELTADDVYLGVNPFFHSFGYKAGIVACLLSGAAMLPQRTFDADRVLDLIETEGVTVIPGAPTLFLSLLSHPDVQRRDLSSLRLAVTGAAVVPVVLVERMQNELSFSSVITAYGLSEAVVVTMCRVDDTPEVVSRTSGRPTAGFEVRIAGADGAAAPTGEDGEILARGPNVMLGYLDDAAATREAIDADGWLHTGDVGHLDERGYLTITDRLKDMYTVGGFNVYPAEVEQTIDAIDGVLECAVVGVADERLGEVGKAFVVPRPGARLQAEQVLDACRARLANFKLPRSVEFVDGLPRNATGKVLKGELRERA